MEADERYQREIALAHAVDIAKASGSVQAYTKIVEIAEVFYAFLSNNAKLAE